MATALSSLLEEWQSTAEKARLSNLERAEQIKAIHTEIIRRYEPGGPFEKRGLAGLEKQKRRDVGAEMQQMISSGLYGTTTAAGGGRRWEEAVGEPGRMRLEDIMMQRLSQAQLGMAGFMERIEEPYPDYATMASLTQQAASGPARAIETEQPQPRPETSWGKSDPNYMESLFGSGGGRGEGGGTSFAAGQSPLQLQLAAQNRARAAGTTTGTQVAPTTQTGDYSVVPQQPIGQAQIDTAYQKFVENVYARGSYITSGTKKRWMKQQGYS